MFILGFTGTREGMSLRQFSIVTSILQEAKPGEVHHGGCKGADAGFHALAKKLGIKVVLHPPVSMVSQVIFAADEMRKPKPYLTRNREIVNEVQGLLACPVQKQEVLRSGTWATIRYARKKGVPVHIIFP